jgi:hypothetical protein
LNVGAALKAQAADAADYEVLHNLQCKCDVDKYGMWGIAASAVLYVVFALFQEYVGGGSKRVLYVKNDSDKSTRTAAVADSILRPHAEEVQTTHIDSRNISVAQDETEVQNVKFVDMHSGFKHEQKSSFDSVRDHAFIQDATLQDFFERPVLIHTAEWTPGSPLTQSRINPWSLFFDNARVINRICNYRLLRCKLHIKATISGSPFHYGRAMLDYLPKHASDSYTSIRNPYIDFDFTLVTQRPHIILDPTESQGGEMVLPFFHEYDALDITDSDWASMGMLTLSEFSALKSASATLDPITIKIFAWAEEVKFAIPTAQAPPTLTAQAELVAQADEYSKKPVSYVAGAIATMAGSMKSVPAIAPYARATEIGAKGVGALATLFGYSKPIELETTRIKPTTKTDFAITTGKDDCAKLSVDHKQELSIDPRLAGLHDVDEMGINYIAQKQSYLTTLDWSTTTAPETAIGSLLVDPAAHLTNTESGTAHYLPACAFAAIPFKYWRGSMKYRFQVVASRYHRGRLKVVYDPYGASASSPGYNEAYTTIVDIADTRDFTITVGWGQKSTYRLVQPMDDVTTVWTTYDSATYGFGNGTLSLYVVNELVHPDAASDIEIKVWVSAGDDFEVAVPHDVYVRQCTPVTTGNLLQPQAEADSYENDPMGQHLDKHAGGGELTDPSSLVYFGESIRSFRALLKRYNLSRILVKESLLSPGRWQYKFYLNVFPPYPHKYASSSAFTVVDNDLDNHYTGYVIPLNYLSLAYCGWRGSLRHIFDSTPLHVDDTPAPSTVRVLRCCEDKAENEVFLASTSLSTDSNVVNLLNQNYDETGYGGSTLESTTINPCISAEIPFYTNKRFYPTRTRFVPSFSVSNGGDQLIVSGDFVSKGGSNRYLKDYVAVGEDFTYLFYIGPPRLYLQESIPAAP